ncbi:MAG TPA: hypothetical protein VFL03_06075 [Candidatus Limnocylindrales bacterium]|jgi:hypothetical protein|nr:hypothetical protein [Candidatus Limnocylindrales bacterium]
MARPNPSKAAVRPASAADREAAWAAHVQALSARGMPAKHDASNATAAFASQFAAHARAVRRLNGKPG